MPLFFFFNDTAPTEIYTLSLHDALPISQRTFGEIGIGATVEHTGSPRPCLPAVEAEIVSIATEAMSNARQHADCRTVRVTCSYGARELRVRVRDDGRGFDAAGVPPEGHWGLTGMRERAASIGARLEIQSASG